MANRDKNYSNQTAELKRLQKNTLVVELNRTKAESQQRVADMEQHVADYANTIRLLTESLQVANARSSAHEWAVRADLIWNCAIFGLLHLLGPKWYFGNGPLRTWRIVHAIWVLVLGNMAFLSPVVLDPLVVVFGTF